MNRKYSYPDDWNCLSLNSICNLITDGTHQSPKSKGGPFKYVTSKNVLFGKIDFETCGSISEKEHNDIYKSCPVKKGDLLLTKDGAKTGNAAINNNKEPFSILSSVALIRGNNKKVLNEYILQYILSPMGQHAFTSEMCGQAITRITLRTIKKIKIPVPSFSEQKILVSILSTWDRAIGQVMELIKLKERRKRALMQKLLSGRMRFPEFVNSNKRRKTRFGDVPEDWDFTNIADIACEVSERLGNKKGITVLSCTKYKGLVSSLKYFGKQIFSEDQSNYKIVRKGYFAYATNHIEEGSIGLLDSPDIGCVSPMYTVFRTTNDVDVNFLYFLLKTEHYIQIYEKLTSASINRRGSLRWKEFKKIPIAIPSKDEQVKITSCLKSCDIDIKILKDKLEALKIQKQGLMQKLLTGQIRVKA